MREVSNNAFCFRDSRLKATITKQRLNTLMIHLILPVAFGSVIYLLFRSKHLLVFHWFNSLGLYPVILTARQYTNIYEQIPAWMIYSLPNGLWAYSFMFFISCIWRNTKAPERTLFVFMVLALSLGSEIGQLLGIVPGLFCIEDCIAYIFGLSLGFYLGNKLPKEATRVENV